MQSEGPPTSLHRILCQLFCVMDVRMLRCKARFQRKIRKQFQWEDVGTGC